MEETLGLFDTLSDELARAVADMGYSEATPIQAAAIPPMLEGKDVIGQAQTGTGKTAAFGIPLAQLIDSADKSVQAIVLCPTRELAVQTNGEVMKLLRHRPGIRTLAVYGGAPIERQLRALQMGAQVIVGTPGRVMDHMRRGSLDLSGVRLAVLDEADEMLDMGFRDDIEEILSATPETRQTALFSATMPRPIFSLARRYLKDPVQVTIAKREMTVEKIEQTYISVRSFHKAELLARLLVLNDIHLALVFCNTKKGVEDVVTDLSHRGFSAAGLHGDMRQIERDAIMDRFRHGAVNILVATDVAARGLDVDDIEVVFNYDLPQDVEYYVHRIGRTGRAGKSGRAYTFVVGREVARMWEYRRITGAKILCQKAPDAHAVQKAQAMRVIDDIYVRASEPQSEASLALAQQLLSGVDTENAVAVMLESLIRATGARTDATIDLNPPEPPRTVERRASNAPARRTSGSYDARRPADRRTGGDGRRMPPRPERRNAMPPRSRRNGDARPRSNDK